MALKRSQFCALVSRVDMFIRALPAVRIPTNLTTLKMMPRQRVSDGCVEFVPCMSWKLEGGVVS